MKKPNITEGEWSYIIDNYSGIYANGNCIIILQEDNTEDVKAISAVPDMIDALVDLVEHTDRTTSGERARQRGIKALKKAGCTE